MKETIQSGQMINQYQTVMKLTDGAFGESWQARNAQNDSVVIQLIRDQNMLDMLQQIPPEIPKFSSPDLANLVTIDHQFPLFVWEYISGRHLSTYIQKLKKIKINVALYVARKLLETIRMLAFKGEAHGALRPSRLIITPRKKIIVCGFGIGKLEQEILSQLVARHQPVTQYEDILPYFPQEVLEDQLFDDPKIDIYAVGIILAEMITGRRSTAEEMPATLAQYHIPENLTEIILKAVADFEERYNHPNEMYQALTRMLKLSDHVEKIYVPPPSRAINVSLEAIPADSEEYRIYEQDVISAKQTIDAEVVVAEPADENLDFVKSQKLSKSAFSKDHQASSELKKTVRLDQETLLIFSTFDKKILDSLEQESLWTGILKYFVVSIAMITVTVVLVVVFPALFQGNNTVVFPLLPFYTMTHWLTPLEFLGNVMLGTGLLFLFCLPFLDPDGNLRHNQILRMLLGIYFVLIFVLGLWGIFL